MIEAFPHIHSRTPHRPPSLQTLLGFDFGRQRIGVATGQTITGTATALTTLESRDGRPDWDAIAGLIETWQPDVVITADDHAARHLIKPYFRDAAVPFVFCGVNYYTPAIRVRHPNTTGVIEAFDLESTLRLIRRLHPDLAQIAVINDRTKTGQANRIVIDGVIASLSGDVSPFVPAVVAEALRAKFSD